VAFARVFWITAVLVITAVGGVLLRVVGGYLSIPPFYTTRMYIGNFSLFVV
jgi:hypothetical protein